MSNNELCAALGDGWEIKDNIVVPIMSPRTLNGDGTLVSPYLIANTSDWHALATNVYFGETYNGKYFQMTDNIIVGRMVGTSETNSFQGVFDGDGHTLDVSISGSEQGVAPFHYIAGATIKNLHVTGSVTGSTGSEANSGFHAASLVGFCKNGTTNTIENCLVSTNVFVNQLGGGIVGHALSSTINMTGCVYNGTISNNGNSASPVGGLVGWSDSSTLSFTNCLFTGTYEKGSSEGGFHPIAVKDGESPVTCTVGNTYYYCDVPDQAIDSNNYVTYDAKLAYSITSGNYDVTLAFVGEATEYNVSGITTCGTGLQYENVLYAGKSEVVNLNLIAPPGYAASNDGNADNYTTIGLNENHKFNGHFDGQGYTISGINSTTTSQNQCNGLFGYVGSGAEVKNVTLANATIGDGEKVGGIAGINEGTVTGCHVMDDVTITGALQSSTGHGGIVGSNQGTVSNCVFQGTLTKTFSNPSGPMISYNYGGIAGSNRGTLSDNLVIGATIPATMHSYGAIAGSNNGTLAHNYYVNCTVASNANATGVGVSIYSDRYQRTDVTENDGAVPGNKIILAEHVTSDAVVFTIPAYGDVEEQTFSVAAFGATVTLGYETSGYEITYYVDNNPIEGNTFTMPNEYVEAVVVDATVIPVATLDIAGYGDSSNGWHLIASPLAESVAASEVGNLVAETASDFDLYRFNQAANMEWENWKWEESKHYHFDLEPGKGYLYASKEDVTLIFTGMLYNGSGEITLSKTAGFAFEGWNLVGNPFNEVAYIADSRPFYTMDAEGSNLMASTSNTIEAMEGIFVIAESDGETMTFTTTAPENSGKGLVLNLSQGRDAVIDRAIVRFGEGGTLPKFQFRDNSTKLYIPQDGMDYAVVRSEGMGEMPVNFKAEENGVYTLSLSSDEVSFNYLHLIDNMTGNDVDLLVNPCYTFEAKTTDYASRFKLVFVCGDANADSDFAFISNGNIIVNVEGTLQVMDVNGRILSSEHVNGSCSKAINVVPGVYMLRLINGENVKTQKVVIP